MPYPIYPSDGKIGVGVTNPETELDVKGQVSLRKDGAVGDQTDPRFKLIIQNAGIDQPEFALFYKDAEDPTWRKVAGTESTGTTAAVRDERGSHFEGFLHDGDVDPTFRLNSSPSMRLEMGAGGARVAAGDMERVTNVVTVTTEEDHGFGVGQTVTLDPGETDFPAGTYTVASVPDTDEFTFSDVGSDGVSTGTQYFSAATDVAITREAYQQIGMVVGGSRKFSIYADSMVTEDAIRLVTNGSLEAAKITATATTPYAAGVEFGALIDATAGNKTVTLPTAAGCKGRFYLVKKTDVTANTVTVDPNAAETIDGAATKVLTAQYDRLYIVSDGTNWQVISSVIT